MLVLTRRPGERVMIGPDIVLTVLEFHRGEARLGFDAPPDVVILREELYKAAEATKKAVNAIVAKAKGTQ